jgi:hypothetical protein
VGYGGQRIILLSHGKERAALISIEDLRLLETLHKEKEHGLYQSRQLHSQLAWVHWLGHFVA